MKLSGSYRLHKEKKAVWKALNNPEILKQCIPGCEVFDKENDTLFNVSATNQIGPMNATFLGKVTLSNIIENESYTLTGEGQSSVGFANGKAEVKLTNENDITILVYEVNINVGGKIAQIGSRLINGVAKKMADYFFGHFSDIVAPLKEDEITIKSSVKETRVNKLKSNFLNKYIYSIFGTLVLLIVAVIYFIL